MALKIQALKEDEFYVVVDEFTDDLVTGQLMLKQPVFRNKFLAVNTPGFVDPQGVAHTPVKVMVNPDETNGLYSVTVDADFSGEKSAIMKFKVKQYEGKILGPFDSPKEAVLAKHAARPKTKNEQVSRLQSEGTKKDEELDVLRARLAQLESGKPTIAGPDAPEPAGPGPKD